MCENELHSIIYKMECLGYSFYKRSMRHKMYPDESFSIEEDAYHKEMKLLHDKIKHYNVERMMNGNQE